MAAVTAATKATLNPCLKGFWLQKDINIRVLYGGRASSKSWDAAGFATFLADNYQLRFLCVRQFQNKIEESVYALLKTQIARFGLGARFDIQKNKIYNRATNTEFMFYGLWRDIDSVKSIEGIDVLWIEEGHALTEAQWDVLEPTIRKAGSQVWLVFNPKLATDFAYKRFVLNPPPKTLVRLINYPENPFLSQKMLEVIEAQKNEDYEKYQHIYLGVPLENDDAVVIKRSWIMASLDAHIKLNLKPSGARRKGFDIADSGDDKCATVDAHGFVVDAADEWKGGEDELLKSCTRVFHAARSNGAHINYDSIGVGASAGAKFAELNAARGEGAAISYAKFNAGGKVWRPEAKYGLTQTKNEDHFANIKAQAWWLVADRFRNTYNAVMNGEKFEEDQLISISSKIPHLMKLIDELSTPRRDFDQNGKVKVESKKDLQKSNREGGPVPSPNLADAFIMAFAPGLMPMKINPALLNSTKAKK